MDRYVFRGKRTDNGEWVYGYYLYVPRGDRTEILNMESEYTYCVVDPNTIGQCTGIKDKNGNLIYEGDIVKVIDDWDRGYINHLFSVGWNDNRYCLFEESGLSWKWPELLNEHTIEIIGNIHDKN